jgi:hypothetical protein
MAEIRSLKPNVTMEQAVQQFTAAGLLSQIRHVVFGPLCSVAELYIPFRLFEVTVFNQGKCNRYTLGLDMVAGSLNPYGFSMLPSDHEVLCLETRNCVPSSLNDTEANELILVKVQRILFSSGFFRIRNLRIKAQAIPGELHVPYWVGFRGKSTRAHVTAMDAVRRRLEGGKVRSLLQNWLLNSPLQSESN